MSTSQEPGSKSQEPGSEPQEPGSGQTAFHLGDQHDLANGDVRRIEVGANGIALCRVNGVLYALDDNCSHADTPLSEGLLRGHQLICPLHGASFDVRDGGHSGPPAYTGVPCYRVTEDDTGVSVIATPPQSRGDGFGDVGTMFRTR